MRQLLKGYGTTLVNLYPQELVQCLILMGIESMLIKGKEKNKVCKISGGKGSREGGRKERSKERSWLLVGQFIHWIHPANICLEM